MLHSSHESLHYMAPCSASAATISVTDSTIHATPSSIGLLPADGSPHAAQHADTQHAATAGAIPCLAEEGAVMTRRATGMISCASALEL